MPGMLLASTVEPDLRFEMDCCTGEYVLAGVGYRFDQSKTVGLQLGVGHSTGRYTHMDSPATAPIRSPVTLVPIDVGAYIEVNAYDRLWGHASLGIHLDRMTDPDDMPDVPDATVTQAAIGIGLGGGIDLLTLGRHRLGVGAHITGSLGSESGYSALTFGLVYRRN
jgi:hypothetical protein